MFDLTNALDLHVHSAPDVYPRWGDDLTTARAGAQAGMLGMVLKHHHEPTSGRAAVVNATLGDTPFRAFGSVTLNHAVGGLNLTAVETALRMGAKVVWLPTVDSAAHASAFGHTGSWDVQGASFSVPRPAPLTILDDAGNVLPSVKEIIALCRGRRAALGTGHLGKDEVVALVKTARDLNFARLIITHPLFRVPGFTPAELSELGEMFRYGLMFEFTYCSVSPMWRHTTIEETVAAIHVVGVEHALLTSDGGQTHNPPPHEGLRLLAQMCHERGISAADVRKMIIDVPIQLIGHS